MRNPHFFIAILCWLPADSLCSAFHVHCKVSIIMVLINDKTLHLQTERKN